MHVRTTRTCSIFNFFGCDDTDTTPAPTRPINVARQPATGDKFNFGGGTLFSTLTLGDATNDQFKYPAGCKIGVVYDSRGRDITQELSSRLAASQNGIQFGSHYFEKGVIFGAPEALALIDRDKTVRSPNGGITMTLRM